MSSYGRKVLGTWKLPRVYCTLWTIFVRGAMIHAMAQLHWINSDCTAQISLLDLSLQGFAECGHVGTCLIDRNDQTNRISESTFIGKNETSLTRKNPRNQGKFRRNQLYTMPFGVVHSWVHHIMMAFDHFGGVSCWRFIVDWKLQRREIELLPTMELERQTRGRHFFFHDNNPWYIYLHLFDVSFKCK